MAKILVMTDIHLTSPGQEIVGLDSFERFSLGLSHAATAHPDADRLVLLGDLAHSGARQEYERLAKALAGAPWPVSFMLGNHDDRANFLDVFPNAATDQNGFVQSVVELDEVALITLDSLDPDCGVKHAGRLCPDRLGFLKQSLAKTQKPCLVFVHHAPFETGFSGMDRINLLNAQELRAALKGSAALHLFAGHIHRTITASIDGLAITTFKSTCHQMPMLLGELGTAHSIDEPGAYGIILTDGASVVVHFEDFSLPPSEITQESESG